MVVLDSFPFQEDGDVQYLGGVRCSSHISAGHQRPVEIRFGSADASLASCGNYSLNTVYESHESVEPVEYIRFQHSQAYMEGAENSQGYMKCRLCSYQTKIESLLRRHVIKHSMDSSFRCPACDFRENDAGKFVDHIGTHQSGKLVRCCFCPKKMARGKLKNHIRIHRAVELYDCSMCQFSTNYEKNIKSHMDVYHTKEHSCQQCGQIMTKHDLHWHMKFVHSMEPSETTEKIVPVAVPAGRGMNSQIPKIPNKSMSDQSTSIFSRKFGTSITSRKTSHALKMQKHIVVKKQFNCGKCEYKTPFKKLLRTHRAKHLLDNSLVCTKCGFKESGPGKFASHLAMHSPVDLFECCFCGFQTPTRGTMSNHVSKHKPLPMFDCPECEFSARRPASVRTHMKRRHGKRLQSKSCGLEMSRFALASDQTESHIQQSDNVPDPGTPSSACLETESHETATEPATLQRTGSNSQPDENTVACEFCKKPYAKSYLRKHVKKCSLQPEPDQQFRKDRESEASLPVFQPITSNLANDGVSAAKFIPDVISDHPGPGTSREALILKSLDKQKKPHLQCNSCSFKTRKKQLLKKHVVKHLIDFRLNCPECGHKEMSSFRFAHHVLQHGSDPETFQCCFCSLSTPTSKRSYCAHLDLHRPVNIFDCPKCEYSSNRADCVRNHFKNNHSKNRKCQHCGEVMSKARLVKHLLECHGEAKDVNFKLGETDGAPPNEASFSHPVTTKQGDLSLDNSEVQSVVDAGDGLQYSFEFTQMVQAELNPYEIEMPLVETEQDFLKCTKCTFRTRIQSLMDRHIAKHLIDVPFVCPLCGFEHLSSRKFANHWDKHECNSKKKVYRCCFCDAEIKKKNCLKAFLPQHFEDHRRVALQDCSECEFSSRSRYELDKHFKNEHIKKCECLLCGKVMSIFEYSSHAECKGGSLAEHVNESAETTNGIDKSVDFSTLRRRSAEVQDSLIAALEDPTSLFDAEPSALGVGSSALGAGSSKTISPESRPNPVIKEMLHCSKCDYSTQFKSLLQRHVLKHLIDIPFSCKHCSFSSFDERTFADHVHTHTGSYRCIFCHYRAGNYTVATRHYSCHKALATNDCPKCEFTSTYKYRLVEHLRGKHMSVPKCSYCGKKMLTEELKSHEKDCGTLFRSMSHIESSCIVQMVKDGLTLDTSPRALAERYVRCRAPLNQDSGSDGQAPPVSTQGHPSFDESCQHTGQAEGSVHHSAEIQPLLPLVQRQVDIAAETSHVVDGKVVRMSHESNAVTDLVCQKPGMALPDPVYLVSLPKTSTLADREPTLNQGSHCPPVTMNQDPIRLGSRIETSPFAAVTPESKSAAVMCQDPGLKPLVCLASSATISSDAHDVPPFPQESSSVATLSSQDPGMQPFVCFPSLAALSPRADDVPKLIQKSSSTSSCNAQSAVTSIQDIGLKSSVCSSSLPTTSSHARNVQSLIQDSISGAGLPCQVPISRASFVETPAYADDEPVVPQESNATAVQG